MLSTGGIVVADQRSIAVKIRSYLSGLIAPADDQSRRDEIIPPVVGPPIQTARLPRPVAPEVDDLVQYFRIIAARRSGEGRGVLPYRNTRASRVFHVRPRRAVVPVSFIRSDISHGDPWWTEDAVDHTEAEIADDKREPVETAIDLMLLDGRSVRQIRREIVSDGKRRKDFVARFDDGSETRFGEIAHKLLPLSGAELLPNSGPIIVTEGAKAANALRERGLHAVGTLTGALGTPSSKAIGVLKGRDVILWPDNDAVGVRHMQRVAKRLAEVGPKSVRIARWIGAPRKADAADFNGTDQDLGELLDAATEWSETTPVGGRGTVHVNPGRPAMRLTLEADDRPSLGDE